MMLIQMPKVSFQHRCVQTLSEKLGLQGRLYHPAAVLLCLVETDFHRMLWKYQHFCPSTQAEAAQQKCSLSANRPCHSKGAGQNSIRKLNEQGGNIGGKGKHQKEAKKGTAKVKALKK